LTTIFIYLLFLFPHETCIPADGFFSAGGVHDSNKTCLISFYPKFAVTGFNATSDDYISKHQPSALFNNFKHIPVIFQVYAFKKLIIKKKHVNKKYGYRKTSFIKFILISGFTSL